MYKLDEEFKTALAIDGLDEAARNEIYAKAEKTVNDRANLKLTQSLGEEKANEFSDIADGDQQNTWNFLNTNLPTWESTPEWKMFRENFVGDIELSSDQFNTLARLFASVKWLGINAPQYAELLSDARDEIYDGIIGMRDQILQNQKTA